LEFGLGVFRLTSLLRLYRDAFAGLPREIWLISLVGFINRAGTMVMAFVGVWLAEVHHLPAGEAAQFLAIWGLGSCVGVPLGGRLTDRIGAVPVQVMSFVGVSFAFMALPGLGGLWEVGGVLFLVWWWFGARPVAPVEDDDDASAG